MLLNGPDMNEKREDKIRRRIIIIHAYNAKANICLDQSNSIPYTTLSAI